MARRRRGTLQERLDAALEDQSRWLDSLLRAATKLKKLRSEIDRLQRLDDSFRKSTEPKKPRRRFR